MVFILSDDGRDEPFPAVDIDFQRYNEYVANSKANFPPRAFELATSDWFYHPGDHRCPHDAWLDAFQLSETPEAKAHLRPRLT
jgi:hypothetical protein